MPNLLIKNVPQPVIDALRDRAQRNHRSLQDELLALVCQAAEADVGSAWVSRSPDTGTLSIQSIAADNRARRKKPVTQGPRAVDVIRGDRDAR